MGGERQNPKRGRKRPLPYDDYMAKIAMKATAGFIEGSAGTYKEYLFQKSRSAFPVRKESVDNVGDLDASMSPHAELDDNNNGDNDDSIRMLGAQVACTAMSENICTFISTIPVPTISRLASSNFTRTTHSPVASKHACR